MRKILIVVPDFRKNTIGGNITSFNFLINNKNKIAKICSFVTKKANLYPNVTYFFINFKSIFNFYLFIKKNNFDIIYLNSFFSFYNSILIILILKLFTKNKKKFFISPRGELFYSLINIKLRKKLFIKFTNFFYRNFFYIASNDFEKKSINKILKANHIYIYNDLH